MQIDYRPIEAGDAGAVRRLAGRAFRGLGRLMVSLEDGGHVALRAGEIVGASVLKSFEAAGRRFGLVEWIMTDPDAQGHGVATRLMELGDAWFAEREVDAALAMVEGYNQSSSKLFLTRGYRRLRPAEHLRVLGAAMPAVWLKTFLLTAPGHFIWYRASSAADRPTTQREPSALGSLLATIAFTALLVGIVVLRAGIRAPLPETLVALAAVPAGLVAVRAAAFGLGARLAGVRTRFRGWEGGTPLAIVIAAVTGGYMALPGSLYPVDEPYFYRDVARALGIAGLVAIVVQAALVLALRITLADPPALGVFDVALRLTAALLPAGLIVDLIPVFPLWSYSGRRVWQWSRAAWVVGVVVAAVAIFMPV